MSDKKNKYYTTDDVSLAGKALKKGDEVQMTEANGKRLISRGILCHEKPKADSKKADK